MILVRRKGKWVVYDDDGKVIIICTNKNIAVKFAKEK